MACFCVAGSTVALSLVHQVQSRLFGLAAAGMLSCPSGSEGAASYMLCCDSGDMQGPLLHQQAGLPLRQDMLRYHSQRPVHFLLQEQEFCEVSNDSPTDPACWLARIKRVNKDSYLVS